MNERIRELAEQADRWSQKMTRSDDPRYGGRPVSGLFEEKFVELIIQEANDVIYSLLEENTGAEVVVRIKEHFGVE